MAISEELKAKVREELPEVEEISDSDLRGKVVEAWATALDRSSFGAISEIKPSGNPDTRPLKRGTQADHIRGVTRLAMAMADEMNAMFPELKIDRDILIAGGLCHDVGKPWEFDPENQKRWKASSRTAGLPSIRHPFLLLRFFRRIDGWRKGHICGRKHPSCVSAKRWIRINGRGRQRWISDNASGHF